MAGAGAEGREQHVPQRAEVEGRHFGRGGQGRFGPQKLVLNPCALKNVKSYSELIILNYDYGLDSNKQID